MRGEFAHFSATKLIKGLDAVVAEQGHELHTRTAGRLHKPSTVPPNPTLCGQGWPTQAV